MKNPNLNFEVNEQIIQAAKFFLKHNGMIGTPNQIHKILKQVGPSILRMAIEHGFKA